VSDQFHFAIELVDVPAFDEMLRQIAGCVVERAGYAPSNVAEISAALRSPLDQIKAEGVRECDVQFRSDAGRLTITLASRDGRTWRVTRPLPEAD
jgi:hypothetical protein